MYYKHFLFAALTAVILLSGGKALKAQSIENFIPDYKNSEMYKIQQDRKEIWKDVPLEKQKGWKQYKRWEAFWAPRLWPDGTFINAAKIYSDNLSRMQFGKQDRLQSNRWSQVGPFAPPAQYNNQTSLSGVGRINIVRFHPTNPNILWAGSASGGVWRSSDKGKTWETFPFTQFLSLGVSDIAISPSDPNTVYVATGDADGTLGTATYCYSIGIIKTTDGGATWSVTGLTKNLPDKFNVSRLMISPTDPNSLLAATTSGIMKTTDGGATWTRTQGGNFRDMEMKPNDPNTIYASTYGRSSINSIYKSTDFGTTWTLKKEIKEAGRIQLAVTPSAPDLVYALCSHYIHNGFHSFQMSQNSGETFEVLSDSTDGNVLNWGGYDLGTSKGQSDYDLCLAVKLTDPTKVILGGIECYTSGDNGYTWTKCTNTRTSGSKVHVDMHDLVYNPLDKMLYLCSDGGIYTSADDGTNWTSLSDGIAITQFYRFGVSETNPEHIICGAQDNGTSMYDNGSWYQIYGGDGMDCAIDPTNDKKIYCSIYYGSIYKSTDNGKTLTTIFEKNDSQEEAAWTSPFTIDPQNSKILYVGHNNVWKNSNSGEGTWSKISNFNNGYTLNVIAVAPSDSKYIYAVALNQLYKTTDGGANWSLVTSASNSISSVTVSPTEPNRIWYTLSGFNDHNKVFMYDGTETINLSGNLPNIPVTSSVYENGTNDRIYIGTDIGVFYSDCQSNIWDNINDNLPNVTINDLQINYKTTPAKLFAATYGNGVWKSDVVTCDAVQLTTDPATSQEKCPTDFVVITAGDGYSNYVWSDGTTGRTLRTSAEGNFSVSAKSGDCTVRSHVISVNNIPTSAVTISVVNSQPACIGDTIELNASLGFKSYLWSTGDTTKRIKVTKSGDFWVKGMKGAACDSYSDTMHVEFYPYPDKPKISTNGDTLVCDDSLAFYQWFLNGQAIKNAAGKTYVPDTTGTYTVFGMNAGKCGTMSDEIYYEKSAVELESQNTITVFPNPSRGSFKLNLTCRTGDEISYTVSNSAGQKILNLKKHSDSEEFTNMIDLSQFSDGAYILALKINGKLTTINLIKQ